MGSGSTRSKKRRRRRNIIYFCVLLFIYFHAFLFSRSSQNRIENTARNHANGNYSSSRGNDFMDNNNDDGHDDYNAIAVNKPDAVAGSRKWRWTRQRIIQKDNWIEVSKLTIGDQKRSEAIVSRLRFVASSHAMQFAFTLALNTFKI